MEAQYSLWFVPPEPEAERLSTVIAGLSRDYGTPAFPPHVTLLGDLPASEQEVLTKAAELAAAVRPFTIELDGFGCSDEYFRSIFVAVETSASLIRAYEAAVELFGGDAPNGYEPHLSLMYGEVPAVAKQELLTRLGAIPSGFEVRSVHVAFSSSRVPTSSWSVVREFVLTER